ncbi:MAG: hypothetical protein ABSC93_21230 [Bryobacteraceae bacterium]|jgi:hypothetical protein
MEKRAVYVLGLLAMGVVCPAFAEDAAILRQNEFELGLFGGFSYGVDHSRFMGGGNVTYSALSWLLPYAEVSYFPSIQRTAFSPSNGDKEVYDLPLSDVNFGVHIRKRLPHTPIVPYLVAGVGLLHSPEREEKRYTLTDTGYSKTYDLVPVAASTDFAENVGAGFRWYIKEQFGLRAETKGYHLSGGPLTAAGTGSHWIGRATFGIFFQFGR